MSAALSCTTPNASAAIERSANASIWLVVGAQLDTRHDGLFFYTRV